MNNEQGKIKDFLNSLAAAVINAIRDGSPEDRKRLVATLNEINANMPGISEDTAEAKEFLAALIGLLEGNPVGADALSGGYRDIYARITAKAFEPAHPHGHDPEREFREFITQLSAAVVIVMRSGNEDDKKSLAKKLREVKEALPPERVDAGALVLALAAVLEGGPSAPDSLPRAYASFYKDILATIKNSS